MRGRGVFVSFAAMKPVVPGGFLIAIEGVDGSGKTTVSALLAQYLGERGLLCTLSKEPTGLGFGRRLRESAKTGRLSVEDELDLFLRDRMDHARRSIRPALAAGAVVILDRYYWSTAAYQGARGVDPAGIIAANEVEVPRPNLVLLLDVPAEAGLARVRVRGDVPNEFEKVAALEKARAIFRDLHERHPEFSVCLDGGAPARDVHRRALAEFLTTLIGEIRARQPDAVGAEAVVSLLEA